MNYNLDGGSNTSGLRNTGNVAPNPDAVQEFRVTTSSYPADEGRFGGGTVTMITKSGTNDLHGSLFEFIRNTKLNANRWVPGGSNLTKDPLHRNQFGGTAGGPIIRNRTFVFGSYSGLRERTTHFQERRHPVDRRGARRRSLAQRRHGAHRSADRPRLSRPHHPRRPHRPRGEEDHGRRICRCPTFRARTATRSRSRHPRDTDEILTKVDHNFSDAHRITGSLFYSTGADTTGLIGNIDWVDRSFQWQQYNYNVKETWIVSPNKINEFRIAYIRNFGGRVDLPQISLGDLGSKFHDPGHALAAADSGLRPLQYEQRAGRPDRGEQSVSGARYFQHQHQPAQPPRRRRGHPGEDGSRCAADQLR